MQTANRKGNLGIGMHRGLSLDKGDHNGLISCQTLSVLSRFITYVTDAASLTSHCVMCVTLFNLAFKQKKYYKCFSSRC